MGLQLPRRRLRRAQRKVEHVLAVTDAAVSAALADKHDLEIAFARRLLQAADTLQSGAGANDPVTVKHALDALEEALASSLSQDRAKAWLTLVAVAGSFPNAPTVDSAARILRMDGPTGLREDLLRRFARSLKRGLATTSELDVRRERVVVDVTHTLGAVDLHAGIQRVVRETVAQWLARKRPVDLMRMDLRLPALRRLSQQECEHFVNWRTNVTASTDGGVYGIAGNTRQTTLVPWNCRLLIPELPLEPKRTVAYQGLTTSSVLESFSLIGYDLIPIVASETVLEGMAEAPVLSAPNVTGPDALASCRGADARPDAYRGCALRALFRRAPCGARRRLT
jgi:hypothetical protein